MLRNGDEVALFAVQAVDRERAVRAVEGLRALLAAAQAQEPAPPAAALRRLTGMGREGPGMTCDARRCSMGAPRCFIEAREPSSGPPGR